MDLRWFILFDLLEFFWPTQLLYLVLQHCILHLPVCSSWICPVPFCLYILYSPLYSGPTRLSFPLSDSCTALDLSPTLWTPMTSTFVHPVPTVVTATHSFLLNTCYLPSALDPTLTPHAHLLDWILLERTMQVGYHRS